MKKIYKYTSLHSAILILKSGGVVLNNPENFNDPNDCSFFDDKKEKIKSGKIIDDYAAYKAIDHLVSLKEITPRKRDKMLLSFIQWEMMILKRGLERYPFFTGIPGFGIINKMICSKSSEYEKLAVSEKKKLLTRIDSEIKNAKDAALISCFSKRNDSILMWSHYADSHKGVCIEFEKPKLDDFRDVKYKKNRPSIRYFKVVQHAIALDMLNKHEDENQIKRYLENTTDPFFVKSPDWSYEKEVRCLYSKTNLCGNIRFDGKKHILMMGNPTAIYIGCNASGREVDRLYELAQSMGIPIFFMKKSEKTFDIVVDKEHKYQPSIVEKTTEITLLRLINDINGCLDSKAFLAAFSASLVIPAICCQVECKKNADQKDRYIKWCNTYLPCTDKGPDSDGISYLSGEVIWKLKERLFSYGNLDIQGKYQDFEIHDITLQIQERNNWDIYTDLLGEGNITTNVTKFCVDMIRQAERCYKKHEKEIKALSQIPVVDYDDFLV